MKSLYLLVDGGTILIPFIFSFHHRIRFYKTWKPFFLAAGLVAIFFLAWDILFTSKGVWSFNTNYTMGWRFLNLPIEEILFFICIPFSCIFTYFCLDKFYDLSWNARAEGIFCVVFSLFLGAVGLLSIGKWYTSVSMISAALISLYLYFIARVDWFGKSITVYLILLIPFLLVNGILTGTGLPSPVVQYNNSQNLGLRIHTIPVEDIFYGMELFLLNLYFYKIFVEKYPPLKEEPNVSISGI